LQGRNRIPSSAAEGVEGMFTTTAEFNVDAPVVGVGSEESPALDALVARWRSDQAVSTVAVEWKALPRAGDALVGAAEVRVVLRGDSRAALRKAYDRLTRQITREGSLRLGGRTCVLTDMFE
jgi:hypothetical protein